MRSPASGDTTEAEGKSVMERRTFLAMVSARSLLAAPRAAEAQPAGKVARVGLLNLASRPAAPGVAEQAIVEGLKEHGYIEGQNLNIERRFAEGEASRLPQLAADLVRLPVDVILVAGPGPIQAAKQATRTIPIVMAAGSVDPVAEGLVASLARPGGNITGLTYAASAERFGKQLELLKTAANRISRIAVLWDLPVDVFRRTWAAPVRDAAQRLGLEVQEPVIVNTAQGLSRAFEMIHEQRAQAVLVATGGVIFGARRSVGELAVQYGLLHHLRRVRHGQRAQQECVPARPLEHVDGPPATRGVEVRGDQTGGEGAFSWGCA